LSLPQSVRPTGIKVLIILFIISIGSSTVGYFLINPLLYSSYIPSFFGEDTFFYRMEIFLDTLIIIGLYYARPLTRKFLLVIGWIGLIVGIISIIYIPIAIVFGILVWYLKKPHVKEYFGIDSV